jgi:predicted Rossmann-fold nucleotide-binding protein
MAYHEIEDHASLVRIIQAGGTLRHFAFQGIDFRPYLDMARECMFSDCLFLGGSGIDEVMGRMDERCLIFPRFNDIPFRAFRSGLYDAGSLYEGYCPGKPESYADCYDSKVYQHYLSAGKQTGDIKETLARILHDHSMNDGVDDFLRSFDEKSIVGVMGGHGLSRTDGFYRTVVMLSKRLTESGSIMVSGGGPGAMEATHLGAWMAGRSDEEVDQALEILSKAPSYKDELWLDTAFQVMQRFPAAAYVSLGVPTWLYGHEPATPFATHIAKYFDNSTREDSILTIAKGGVIYSPGSAGTMQEIFQDAVQNHYLSFGYASPMVFLGKEYWTEEMPVYRLMTHLTEKGKYKNLLLSLTDSIDEIAEIIENFRSGEAY